MKNKNSYYVLGMMSGTSLDGVDLALCHFMPEGDKWSFELVKGQTINYSDKLKYKLSIATELNGFDLHNLDLELARVFSKEINIISSNYQVDFLACHGHTIFHQPEKSITLQIGNAKLIHKLTAKPIISDFRSMDVFLGGQGAPLVPIADRDLYSEYEYCLNLGGIANVSFDNSQKRVAFDITPCNMLLNHIANQCGKEYDFKGNIARSGTPIDGLLTKWNSKDFFEKKWPKSLGIEWVSKNYFDDVGGSKQDLKDIMATAVEHIALQIVRVIRTDKSVSLLVTGGGAKNDYFIERLSFHLRDNVQLIIPDMDIIDFKEGIAFAYVGLLRFCNKTNVLCSVTGASRDSCSGTMIGF